MSDQPEETYEKFLLPSLPPEFSHLEQPSETFNREEFETDPLAWVDRNRGF